MFKNYAKLALRNLFKNKLSSSINIIGLATAIGCSIVFFLLLYLEYTSDHFHQHKDQIFLVGYQLEGDQKNERWGDSPLPLAPIMQEEFPQIIRAVRCQYQQATLRHRDKVFKDSVAFVDPGFLEMFTFPLKSGHQDALMDNNGLIFSKEAAEKYFGNVNPIGRQVQVVLGNNFRESFFVKGVLEKPPVNSSLKFNILGSLKKLEELQPDEFSDWGRLVDATFIQVTNPLSIDTIEEKSVKYLAHQRKSRADRPLSAFFFQPLASLSWESQHIRNSISSGSTPEALILFFVIGLFLLIQACFNYINIALASATSRLKEIGIRKVVGSKKGQLTRQFLGENLLLCFISLLAALVLTEFVLLPGLQGITGDQEPISLGYFFKNLHVWIFLISLLVFTGLCAGAYPALYISRLEPARIFRGKFKFKGKKRFTSFLLGIQFSIAFVILCLVAAFWQNNQYQLRRDWGYNQEQVINIKLDKNGQFALLKNALSQEPEIQEIAGTRHHVGKMEQQAIVEYQAKKHEVIRFDVGINYMNTLGIRLGEGRFFNESLATDLHSSLMVNRTMVAEMGWKNPVGKPLRYNNKIYRVIGVVEDFHYDDFYNEIRPVIIRLVKDKFQYLALRLKPGTAIKSASFFANKWKELFPDEAYQAYFQDSVFDHAFRSNQQITKIFGATAIITLLISCMGLFGLASLMISKRMKELAIHKLLGASLSQISSLITMRYVVLLVLSMVLTIPFAYIFLGNLLDAVYPYHIDLGPLPFVIGTLTILLTAAFTIVTQVHKAAVKNPIESLKHE